ncbi:hypothetical protein [Jidongwangia harbinensis]|uniref:hypothetical protein n=1 Tax=Jidongwangia harbinensis TaxID=2878561 RepID=UPI001CD963A7|nr:hypothetical protein [Jidongwangia harbinensis]MCA2218748.1 hypothetical protein [Jidongwangia harbinensis]
MSGITWVRRAVVLLAVWCLAAGCTGAQPGKDGGGQRVASLTTGAPQTRPSDDPEDRRPLVRIDRTEAEVENLWAVWGSCAREKGGPRFDDMEMARKIYREGDAEAEAVRTACLAKEPELFEDRQKRTDPTAYKDNQREWYECARKAGYQVTIADPETGEFGLSEIGPNGDFRSPGIEACRRKAFQD